MDDRITRRRVLQAAAVAGLAASATPAAEARGPSGTWVTVPGTTDDNVVVGQEPGLR